MSVNIGDRIKKLRLLKGMTQEEVIDGIASIAYLSKVESGYSKPSDPFIRKVSSRLGINENLLKKPFVLPIIQGDVKRIFDEYWKHDVIDPNDIIIIQLYLTELHDNNTLLMMYSVLIRFFYYNSRLTEAKEMLYISKQIVNYQNPSNDGKCIEFYYYLLSCGVLHFDLYEYEESSKFLLLAEKYVPDDNREKAKLYYNLSKAYEKYSEDKSLCIKYSLKSYEHIKKTNDTNKIVHVLLSISIQYYLIHQPDNALVYSVKAENLLNQSKEEDPLSRATIYYSLGRIYQLKGLFEEASFYFKESILLYESILPEKSIQSYKRLVEINISLREWN